MSPWISIVLFGAAIAGYSWMMPKTPGREKESSFVSEEAYSQLLEDLEAENRELVDAVAKFKREQDDTVSRLGRRIVDLEHVMESWVRRSAGAPQQELFVASSVESREPEAVIAETGGEPEARLAEPAATEKSPLAEPDAPAETIVPLTLRGRYPELFAMHDNGKSVDQIAKEFGMNKGEVQLILQLARREEQQHA
ncbi:hypothetical protein ACFPPD_25515 [Cohnella suwonensis]|uniref:DUF2802 domain-containing protein n=1 Tax=Cohnella suwonensis TaxID=696072 RepID=A0ABW0M2M1_9BACL